MLDEIPNMDDLRSAGSMGRSHERNKKDLESIDVSIRDLDLLKEDKIAKGRYLLNRKVLEYYKNFNKWRRHCDKIFEICDPETLQIHQSSDYGHSKKPSLKSQQMAQALHQQDSDDNLHITIIPLALWKSILLRIASVFCLCVSIIIIFSETVLIFSEYNDILPFQEIVKTSTNKAGLVCFFFLLLCYIFYCTYFALFRMDLGSFFSLYPEHTHHLTLIFCNKVCMTLMFALCYNFLLLFGQISIYEDNGDKFVFRNGFDLFFEPMKKIPFLGTYYNLIVTLLI